MCHYPKKFCPDAVLSDPPPLPMVDEGAPRGAHLMAGCFRWVLRAWVRTSGEKGGWPERRWTSRCAALLRAWTPASVRLEMTNLTGTTDFSLSAASCGDSRRRRGGNSGQGPESRRTAPCASRGAGLPSAPPWDRPPSGRKTNRAHLQVVLDPDGALGAPDGRDTAVGTGGRRSAGGDLPARVPL